MMASMCTGVDSGQPVSSMQPTLSRSVAPAMSSTSVSIPLCAAQSTSPGACALTTAKLLERSRSVSGKPAYQQGGVRVLGVHC